MLPVTDDPQVTTETRFWLFSEVRSTRYTRYAAGRLDQIIHGEPLRIRYEVDEARYRAAHREQTGEASDITMPLDSHWWRDEPIGYEPGSYLTTLRRTRGGYVQWTEWG